MGIQSTQHITREEAIYRIEQVYDLIHTKSYKDLEDTTSEPDYDIENFINSNWVNILDISNISQWTDTMLEDKMDEPYYRYSMFDNYMIGEEDE